ncbi:MAG: hypothetical protein WB646_19025 [Steroidobacteraceae bacterium]
MNLTKPREHRAWRPRMSSDAEFNPFAHSTDSSNEDFDRRTLEEMDEQRHESAGRDDETEPSKLRGD